MAPVATQDFTLTAEESYEQQTIAVPDCAYLVYHEETKGSGVWTYSGYEDAYFFAVFLQNLESRGFDYYTVDEPPEMVTHSQD